MNKNVERLYNGIIKENPTFVLMLGMCPTLAVTSSAINGLGMGLSTTVVLILSNMLISAFRKVIPDGVRMPAFIVIVASLVTMVQFIMQAYTPSLSESLGVYIPLIVVNCIILGRAESYASKNPVIPSMFDGIGMGLGFTFGLTCIGLIRELLGAGQIFGFQILSLKWFTPITIFVMAPGAFLVLSCLVAIMNIVSLPATQKKVISLSFEPITGLAGDYLPLHIVAIFDAANRIENPTIATAFFQELSQAFPIRVSLDSDSTVSTCEAFYEKSYTVHSLENAKVSKLSNERSEMNSDFLFDSFSESSDVETKQLSLNTPTDIILFNPTEETMSYHLFAFVNNTPVMWDSSPYSSITLPAKSQFSSSILLSDSQMQNISDDSPDLFFLVAVPIHEAAQQQGTLVLKTKTIAFVT